MRLRIDLRFSFQVELLVDPFEMNSAHASLIGA
jgi:hypothetical protein